MIAMGQSEAAIARWLDPVVRALARITSQVVVATFAIALALTAWSLYDAAHGGESTPPAAIFATSIIVNVLIAFSMMLTTFIADEFVMMGAPPLRVYACGILTGSALGALGQWLVHASLRRIHASIPGLQADAAGPYAIFVFLEYLIWGSIIVWIYVNRRGEMRARDRMNASRLQRAHKQRRALEAQLQALQAQVEPRFLLDTLANVRDRYDCDTAAGSTTLGALINYLRAALPQLRESSSHLAREIDLVHAYLGVMRASALAPVELEAKIPAELAAARMPPMVLLPLVNLAVHSHAEARPIAIGMTACEEGARLRVTMCCGCDCFARIAADEALNPVRERLRALYGTASEVAVFASDERAYATVEIPLESTDSRHR